MLLDPSKLREDVIGGPGLLQEDSGSYPYQPILPKVIYNLRNVDDDHARSRYGCSGESGAYHLVDAFVITSPGFFLAILSGWVPSRLDHSLCFIHSGQEGKDEE